VSKPDVFFTVAISPVFDVRGCATKEEQETRGLYGFHNFDTCEDCQVIPRGFEAWGENGHKQAGMPSRQRLIHWIKLKAREQWRMKAGGTMGYRFESGSAIHYKA
jgi:hypothetical protein